MSDSGGIMREQVPVSGRRRVAQFIAIIASHFLKGMTRAYIETNGQPVRKIRRIGQTFSDETSAKRLVNARRTVFREMPVW